MPAGLPPKNKLPAKKRTATKAMYERGMAVTAIADKQGISRRTVTDWAKQGGWQRPADRAAAEASAAGGTGGGGDGASGDQGDSAGKRTAGPPDIDQILAETIADLRSAMTATQKNYDFRPLSNLAMAVLKCLEAWERRHPASPAALAMLAIEMGMKPRVFMEAVAEAWRLNSNGDNCEFED